MDQGVIAWIKARVLNDISGAALLRVLCVEDDAYAVDTADAMCWLGDAWDAMPKKVLANCRWLSKTPITVLCYSTDTDAAAAMACCRSSFLSYTMLSACSLWARERVTLQP
jgi:hypothetical protein